MKCIALATRFSDTAITWHIPKSSHSMSAFFTRQSLKNLEEDLKEQITGLCNTLQSDENIRFKENNHFIHILKLHDDCCAVICDVPLTDKQIRYLALYMLIQRIPLNTIASDIASYTQDIQLQAINADLEETITLLKQNIEKTLERDSKIDNLQEQADLLEERAHQFERTVHEATSFCWPWRCSIL